MTEQEFPNDLSREFEKNIALKSAKEQFTMVVERNFEVRQGIDDFMEPIGNGVLKMKLKNSSNFGPAVARLEKIGKEVVRVNISTIDLDLKF